MRMPGTRGPQRALAWGSRLALVLALVTSAVTAGAQEPPLPATDEAPHPLADASGLALMEAVYQRHQQHPYVYEEQSMVLIDRNGNRETRKLRRYSRLEAGGRARFLLLFDSPREVQGVALLARREPDGSAVKQVYLPALGPQLIESGGPGDDPERAELTSALRDQHFLGTDFSIENLTGEILSDYRYRRQRDMDIDDVPYFVVDVHPRDGDLALDPPLRRHYIRQDHLYITRTDHFDRLGRLVKRHTHHDLRSVGGGMWRANMMLMSNERDRHQTLIKIDRRVFSPDYVPDKVFTPEWLFAQAPIPSEPPADPADENPQAPAAVVPEVGL